MVLKIQNTQIREEIYYLLECYKLFPVEQEEQIIYSTWISTSSRRVKQKNVVMTWIYYKNVDGPAIFDSRWSENVEDIWQSNKIHHWRYE